MKKSVWIASSHLTESQGEIKKLLPFHPDGIVIKSALFLGDPLCKRACTTCAHSYRNKRFLVDPTLPDTYFTFHERQTCEYLFSEEVGDILSWLKSSYPHVERIASIIAKTQEDLVSMARFFEKKGAQIIEFNVQKYFQKTAGSSSVNQIDAIVAMLQTIKQHTTLPIYAKLGPELLTRDVFKKLKGTVEGVTITNSFIYPRPNTWIQQSLKKRDKDECIVHGEPLWPYLKKFLPIARTYFDTVSASGGIHSTKRACDAIALGATSVQLCGAIQLYDPTIITTIKQSIEQSNT